MKKIFIGIFILLIFISTSFASETCENFLSKEYDAINHLKVSSDGESFAFFAKQDGEVLLVKDGEEIEGYTWFGTFNYLKEGQEIVFTAEKDGKNVTVENGRIIPQKGYDWSYIEHDIDGKYKVIRVENGKLVLVGGCYNEEKKIEDAKKKKLVGKANKFLDLLENKTSDYSFIKRQRLYHKYITILNQYSEKTDNQDLKILINIIVERMQNSLDNDSIHFNK